MTWPWPHLVSRRSEQSSKRRPSPLRAIVQQSGRGVRGDGARGHPRSRRQRDPQASPPAEPRFVSSAARASWSPVAGSARRRRRQRLTRRRNWPWRRAAAPQPAPPPPQAPGRPAGLAHVVDELGLGLADVVDRVALSSPWSSPRHENHHFPRRGDSGGSSSSFWSSSTSVSSSTTSMFLPTTPGRASSSATSLSFAAAPAQGDGPDHGRPDSRTTSASRAATCPCRSC